LGLMLLCGQSFQAAARVCRERATRRPFLARASLRRASLVWTHRLAEARTRAQDEVLLRRSPAHVASASILGSPHTAPDSAWEDKGLGHFFDHAPGRGTAARGTRSTRRAQQIVSRHRKNQTPAPEPSIRPIHYLGLFSAGPKTINTGNSPQGWSFLRGQSTYLLRLVVALPACSSLTGKSWARAFWRRKTRLQNRPSFVPTCTPQITTWWDRVFRIVGRISKARGNRLGGPAPCLG